MFYFRNLCGNEITKEEFVENFSKCYFISDRYDDRFNLNTNKSSKYVEDEICNVLHNGVKNTLDVKKILAWKIGKIKHYDSKKAEEIIYAADWQGKDNLCAKRYGRKMDLTDLADYICNNFEELRNTAVDKPQHVLNLLNDVLNEHRIRGIGTVYLLALLFFISNGEYPIYDRFAVKAVNAIKNKNAIPEKKGFLPDPIELPYRNSAEFSSIMCTKMNDYINDLQSIFGEEYKTNRDIDRALWVYGHAF